MTKRQRRAFGRPYFGPSLFDQPYPEWGWWLDRKHTAHGNRRLRAEIRTLHAKCDALWGHNVLAPFDVVLHRIDEDRKANDEARPRLALLSNPPKVLTLEQTGRMCPSQWEGTLEAGLFLYVRFRYGNLDASICRSPEAVVDCVKEIYAEHVGPSRWAGNMDTDEMKQHLKGVLDWSGCVDKAGGESEQGD